MLDADFNNKEQVTKEIWSRFDDTNSIDDSYSQFYYQLEMFPYPSGSCLHMGHVLGYTGSDIRSRYLRMLGFNVLYTIGFDSFGLPAEQFALQTGQHPKITTQNNIDNMIDQLKNISLSYDWNRCISTSDPGYYKWTQWIFLQMYNSFFDHTEVWGDGFGHKICGRAKNIDVLREYLKSGKWIIDSKGLPCPADSNTTNKYTPTDDEIENALNKRRLAYLNDAFVNWCPKLGTVLANEEVNPDGTSERGGFPVEKKRMRQWMLRITDYASRLSTGFEHLKWPEETVIMQKNWIGLKNGYRIVFKIDGSQDQIDVFTTKPETIFGATFIAISRDYPQYGVQCENDQNNDNVFTGIYVLHPITGLKLPVWSASYVLNEYGTGAVMGVPDCDERDYKLATQHNIPIIKVEFNGDLILNPYTQAVSEYQYIFKDLPNLMDPKAFIDILIEHNFVQTYKTCKLRDWLFSRQRYWGEPFPIVYCQNTGKCYPLDESELPLELPDVDFKVVSKLIESGDDVVTPLGVVDEWNLVKGKIIQGKVVTKNIDLNDPEVKLFYRETNTMPNWAGSCWYYLRYLDPHNNKSFCDKAKQIDHKYAVVDYYLGGSEHAVLHYMYARFWHMFLFDMGFVKSPEPFMTLKHQGMINSNAFKRNDYSYVHPDHVQIVDGKYFDEDGQELTKYFGKMGKRFNNSVDPNHFVKKYGNDVMRLFVHFMGPIDHDRTWNTDSIAGMERFIAKIDNMIVKAVQSKHIQSSDKVSIELSKLNTYAKDAYENLKINTLIAECMKFVNLVAKHNISVMDAKNFLIIMSPVIIHATEYLYQYIRANTDVVCKMSILSEQWPAIDTNIDNDTVIKVIKGKKTVFVQSVKRDLVDAAHCKLQMIHNMVHHFDFIPDRIEDFNAIATIYEKNTTLIVKIKN